MSFDKSIHLYSDYTNEVQNNYRNFPFDSFTQHSTIILISINTLREKFANQNILKIISTRISEELNKLKDARFHSS